MAAILDLRQNLRWPRSIFQIVWSKVHVSTEKTLTGKKGSFYLARPLLIWPKSSSVNTANLVKMYYASRDIEFFLWDYYFLARSVRLTPIFVRVRW